MKGIKKIQPKRRTPKQSQLVKKAKRTKVPKHRKKTKVEYPSLTSAS